MRGVWALQEDLPALVLGFLCRSAETAMCQVHLGWAVSREEVTPPTGVSLKAAEATWSLQSSASVEPT